LKLTGSVTAHLGVRHDQGGPTSASRTSPRLGLVWTQGRSTLKVLYGTAFRAPNEYELHYYEANESLQPETIRTVEAVAERYLGRGWRLSISLFDNRIAQLITLQDRDGELGFANRGLNDSRGLEAGLETELRNGLRGQLTYSFQRTTDRDAGQVLTNSPRHLLKLGVTTAIVEERLSAGLDVQYMSGRGTLAGHTLPGFVLANLSLRAPRVVGGLDASVGAYNLFDARYSDPVPKSIDRTRFRRAGGACSSASPGGFEAMGRRLLGIALGRALAAGSEDRIRAAHSRGNPGLRDILGLCGRHLRPSSSNPKIRQSPP